MEPTQRKSDDLILLRFPKEIRDSANGSTSPLSSSIQPVSSAESSLPRNRPPRRLLRKTLALLLLCVFVGSVGALEQEYRSQIEQGVLLAQFQTKLKRVGKTVSSSQSRSIYVSLPGYLKHLDKALVALRRSHNQHCKPTSHSRSQFQWKVPKTRKEWKRAWRLYRFWLWSRAQTTYLRVRQSIAKTVLPPSNNQRTRLCQKTSKTMLQQLRSQLFQSSKRLVQEARRHLKFYGWCQMRWTRYQIAPRHQRWMKILRQRRCRLSCRRGRKAACRSCLKQWRISLQLSRDRFREYYQLIQRERQRRCLYWSAQSKKPSHRGVFHLGEYFWRIQRVLAYTRWLEGHNLCNKACQNLRRRWGFRLQISAKTKPTIHVRLWPEQHKAPTPLLRQIPRKPLGKANGKVLWIPALRTDFFDSKSPNGYWMLLLFLDTKTRHKALLPLAPEPDGFLKQTIQLRTMEIYNDGRQPVRFPTIGPNGQWLAFTTFQQMPWTRAPSFQDPHCWNPSREQKKLATWRSAISVYPLTRSGQPSSTGRHLLTRATLHHLEFHPSSKTPQLLVSAEQAPVAFDSESKPPFDRSSLPQFHPPFSRGEQASLWQIKLQSNRSKFFTPPKALTQSIPSTVDVPFHTDRRQFSILRLRCPLPSALSLLQRGFERPDHIPLPRGYKVLHAGSSSKQIALLLKSPGTAYPSLLVSKRPLSFGQAAAPQRMTSMFRQVRVYRNLTLLAGGRHTEGVILKTDKTLQTLIKGQPFVRYLDPIIHSPSQRIFVLQHWKVPGSKQRKPTATFLLSTPFSKGSPL